VGEGLHFGIRQALSDIVMGGNGLAFGSGGNDETWGKTEGFEGI
jgi:hypothetical protein